MSDDTARDDARQSAAEEPQSRPGTGFWGVAKSVLWAGLGVQSEANRQRDFKQGRMVHFIIGGLVGTLLFMLVVWLWVQSMLAGS